MGKRVNSLITGRHSSLTINSNFRYDNMYILQTDRISESGEFPLDPLTFETKIEELCNESRDKLLHEWLLKCADIFLDERRHWKNYIPRRIGDSLCIIEKFFSCANSLMSSQLRRLVMRSLRHFLQLIARFKVKLRHYRVPISRKCILFLFFGFLRMATILAILITIWL